MMVTAAPEKQERVFGLEDIPRTTLEDLRRWTNHDGPSPALKVEDSELRKVYEDHLEMVKIALEHPVPFALALGLDVFPQQVTTASAVLKYPKLAIRGCHSSGKTFMLAVIAVWWVLRHEDSVVITTAPTQRQIKDIMWKDIRAVAPMVERALRLDLPKCHTGRWDLAPKNSIEGVATDRTVNFQGYHSQNTLIIMDEATGIATDLWGAIEGITSSGNVRIVMAANPTIVSGMFYEASTSDDHEEWHRVSYSALRDNPNMESVGVSEWKLSPKPKGLTDVELGKLATLTHCDIDDPLLDVKATPHMVNRRWIRERWFDWGQRDDPNWYSRALGEFPPEDEMSLFTRESVDRARRPGALDLETATRIDWGIDVAGSGQNDTVLIAQQGLQVLGVWDIPDADARVKTMEIIRPYLMNTASIRVDSVGLGWYFFVDMVNWIRTMPVPCEVIGVDVGKNPMDKSKFLNLRAEIYWLLREFFIDGRMSDVYDEDLRRQLLSLRWETVEQGSRRKLESKKDMKERGVPSPDKADALALACCGYREEDVREPGAVHTWDMEEADEFVISPF